MAEGLAALGAASGATPRSTSVFLRMPGRARLLLSPGRDPLLAGRRNTMASFRSTACVLLLLALGMTPSPSARAEVDAWPLLEVSDDSTVVLYPLYVKEGDFLMMAPFYYRTDSGRDHHVLWPVLKVSDGDIERVAPFYFRSGEDFTLLPLIHQTPDYTAWSLPPLVVRHQGDRRDWFALPNLYVSTKDGELKRLRSFGVLDFERGDKARDLDVLVVAAAHWGDDEHKLRLFPLFSRSVSPDSYWLQVATYMGEETPDTDALTVFPLFSTSQHRAKDQARTSLEILWPFYKRSELRDATGALLERQRRFLIFSDELARGGRRTLRVLGIAVRETLES
jgi:hypothetical protein